MITDRLGTPIARPTDIPTALPIGLARRSDSVTRSDEASHGRTDGRTDEEGTHLDSESCGNASPAGGLQTIHQSPLEWTPGDVVKLDTGEVCGHMAGDVLNPWALLNDIDDDGSAIFYEPEYVEAHAPEWLVRGGSPVVPDGPSAPVDRPVGPAGARDMAEIRRSAAS